MAIITKSGIKELTDRYTKTYIDNPSIMLSGYRQENQTVSDYDGRQLLELMQNADDAKSEVINISLDTKNTILTISNNGEGFSLDGIESLMYTGLSTKNKAEFIGNKGLGFRSILNWVNWVKVQTKEISIRFSKSYSEKYFEKYIVPEQSVQEKIAKEVNEKKLSIGEKPIAALAFPEIIEEQNLDYTTSIVLQFKAEELSHIQGQLSAISEEMLLFLPNIKKLVVEQDGIVIQELNKTVDEAQTIVINESEWNIVKSEDLFYDEKIKYKFSIAWKDDLNVEGYFYNYFQTDVPTDLPCIIHATFDLTSNRKEINGTDANKYILAEIVENLGSIAENHLKKTTADWDAYTFLTRTGNAQRTVLNDFYKAIIEKREAIAVYPTLDNQYLKKEETIYHGEAFSNWVEENGFGVYFSGLLKAPSHSIKIYESGFKHYTSKQLVDISKKISSQISNHNVRAQLIKLFTADSFKALHQSSLTLPLLISTKYLFEENHYEENVFALKIENRNFDFPEYLQIAFINWDFYNELLNTFKTEIEATKEGSEDRSRTLKRLIKNVVELGSNDITDIVRYIVSQTNNRIKEEKEPTLLVKNMVKSLFSIFDPQSNAGNKTAVANIPLLARNGEVRFAEDLFFGKEYTFGADTELIFESVYSDSDYLLDAKEFDLEESEPNAMHSFFEWLGVNQMISFSKNKEISGNELVDYFNFLFNTKNLPKPDQATAYNSTLKAVKINNIKPISKLSFTKLMLLLEKSAELKIELNSTIETNQNSLFFKYGNAYPKPIPVAFSYTYFQIYNLQDFENYTVSEDTELQVLFNAINFEDTVFQNLSDTEKISLKATLKHLGTADSVKDISEERISFMLRNQDKQFPDGDKSQIFYKKCLEYGLENKKSLANLSDFYYAKKGTQNTKLSLEEKEQVYYSDNVLLPQNLLNNFYFINLPKRIGEDNVKEIFGVKLIKDEVNRISIKNEKLFADNYLFKNEIEKLKPYFLSYRLEVIKQSRKTEANLIKSLNVQLVSELQYQFEDGAIYDLNNYEFIPANGIYYLKMSHFTSINDLKSDSSFCDTIAEIVCMMFRVSNQKNTFRRIFKDGSNESHHILATDEKLHLLEDAKKLLGISEEELKFWKKIFPNATFDAEKDENFIASITEIIGQNLPNNYINIDFSNLGNKTGVEFLEWLSLKISFKLEEIITESTLRNWHKDQIDNCIKNYTNNFEKLLWIKVNESGDIIEKKKFFNHLIDFSNASEELATRYCKEYYFVLKPDFKNLVIQWTQDKYLVNLLETVNDEMVVTTKYKHILKTYTFGNNLIDDKENIIKNENSELYSLMYFEGFDEVVKNECEKQTKDFSDPATEEHEEDYNLIIVEGNISKSLLASTSKNSKHNGSSHNSKGENKKAISGKKQEDKVKKSLIKQGYLVNDVSKKTDSKHYDLEYKKEDETEWRFLEVKKDSGGYFFLSKPEKDTALIKENAEKYDVAIVGEKSIHIVKSPFLFDEETFEQNSKFLAVPTEYKINFNIDENKD